MISTTLTTSRGSLKEARKHLCFANQRNNHIFILNPANQMSTNHGNLKLATNLHDFAMCDRRCDTDLCSYSLWNSKKSLLVSFKYLNEITMGVWGDECQSTVPHNFWVVNRQKKASVFNWICLSESYSCFCRWILQILFLQQSWN